MRWRRKRKRKRKIKPDAEWIMHYSSQHDILLVGEGDFSFSVSLAEAFGDATNMVATSLDSRSSVVSKYGCGEENLKTLGEYGCTVLHGVDVHSMDSNPDLKRRFFDRIVFNFPHAGCDSEDINEYSEAQIKRHREPVRGFLMNACNLLSWDGEIPVTHKTTYPYSEWILEELGEEVGVELLEEVKFSKCDYPCYQNKKGYGRLYPNKTFPVGCSSTFKFVERLIFC